MTRRKPKASPEFRNHLRRWDLDAALERYYRRWLDARDRVVEKCLADILGHAREHDAVELAATSAYASVYRGVDRSETSSLMWMRPPEPFSVDAFREAARRIIAMVPRPPVKPWLWRHRFEQLVADGIPAELIKRHFEIY